MREDSVCVHTTPDGLSPKAVTMSFAVGHKMGH
jgi:hypothetical protein